MVVRSLSQDTKKAAAVEFRKRDGEKGGYVLVVRGGSDSKTERLGSAAELTRRLWELDYLRAAKPSIPLGGLAGITPADLQAQYDSVSAQLERVVLGRAKQSSASDLPQKRSKGLPFGLMRGLYVAPDCFDADDETRRQMEGDAE